MSLTAEQEIFVSEKYAEFKKTDEYHEYVKLILIKLPMFEENIIEPMVFDWFVNDRLGIKYDDKYEAPKPAKQEDVPIPVVYQNEEEFYKANPYIKEQQEEFQRQFEEQVKKDAEIAKEAKINEILTNKETKQINQIQIIY